MTTTRHRPIILTIGVFVVACMLFGLWLRPWIRKQRAADLAGAVPQHGTATVTAIYGAEKNDLAKRGKPWAMVRFEGKLIPAASAVGLDRLAPGKPAQITYRVSKSGRIYIDLVQPQTP